MGARPALPRPCGLRAKFAVSLLLLLVAVGAEGACTGVPEEVGQYIAALAEYNMSGAAWLGLAMSLSTAGCTTDALICAEVGHRLFSACACADDASVDVGRTDSTELFRALLEAHARGAGGGEGCCGGRADVVLQEGRPPAYLGGVFAGDDALELARSGPAARCPRYFGQCQQTSREHAQQQDLLLHQLFGNMRGGTFVDVGSVDGFSFSNTYMFERDLGWRGVCIEPHPTSFDTLRRVRGGAAHVNACVSNETATRPYLHCTGYTRMLSGLVDLFPEGHMQRVEREVRQHGGGCEVVESPVRTLQDVLAEHGITHVDLLSVDTEGAELQVLTGMDWGRVSVSVVIVEMMDYAVEGSAPPVDAFLRGRGFERFGYVCQDMVYTSPTFRRHNATLRGCME